MGTQKTLFGDTFTVKDKAIAISIERYDELIKKEAFFDELCKSSDVLVLLNTRLQFKED